jgi:hypothetical protein
MAAIRGVGGMTDRAPLDMFQKGSGDAGTFLLEAAADTVEAEDAHGNGDECMGIMASERNLEPTTFHVNE